MYLDLIARLLLVIGGLNYLFMSTVNVNIFLYIPYPRLLSIFIGLSAAYFVFNRDYYLPFLGKSVIPIGPKKPTENLRQIKLIGLPQNTTVISWGSKESSGDFDNYMSAYGDYANTDISRTNEKGEVTVELPCPSAYHISKFGIDKKLEKHIHYRYELPKNKGMFSRVYTKYLDKNCQ
jgi:hypothetical protein